MSDNQTVAETWPKIEPSDRCDHPAVALDYSLRIDGAAADPTLITQCIRCGAIVESSGWPS
jgi:hypothetical protein